jgi:CheY-like chemotaxis protein
MEMSGSRIIVLINDLIFETRIRAAAEDAGVTAVFTKDGGRLDTLLGGQPTALVIVDLNTAGGQAIEAVVNARSHPSRPRVVCFVSHVDRELAARAHAAGAEVLPRSAFIQQLPQIMAGIRAAAET